MKATDVPVGLWRHFRKKPVLIVARRVEQEEKIETLEGTMTANPGDIVIRGVQGEHYPIKPEIFEATYESAEKDDDAVPEV